MRKRIIEEKSLAFGIRIINMTKYLKEKDTDRNILSQISRSGTSIGANIAEGSYSQSNADYITKHQIALKEANETSYWLSLLYKTKSLSEAEYCSINDDLIEIIKILTSILKTSKGIS